MYPRLAVAVTVVFLAAGPAPAADAFDRYTNPVLAGAAGADGVQEVKQLTPALIAGNDSVVPGAGAALVVIKTNEGRHAKLLVQAARQKVGDQTIPILIVERFVTYKEGTERAVQAAGQNIHLFPGFHFNLDVGQVVPPALGGDLRFAAEGRKSYAEPLAKARMYLVTKPLPGATAKKSDRPVIGEAFEPRYFNGTYKLYDDGRRSGTLTLKVADDGDVSGEYVSDKDGQKYEVFGKVGSPNYAIQFTIKFPRTRQVFQGWMFTGDGRAITGSSRLEDREAGFYAVRADQG